MGPMDGEIDEVFNSAGCTGAVHVCRLSDGAEVAVREDEVWLAASVIKVPIALEFYARADDGRLDPTRMVTLEPERRTPGPTGISAADDPVTMSSRDLCAAMLAVSDNAATDAVLGQVGVAAVNARLMTLGCTSTALVESLLESINALAVELGFADYATLLRAQAGELGSGAKQISTDQERIGAARVLDPARATRTTARDMTRLLSAVWRDEAASKAACADLRRAMAGQVTRRLAPAVPEGGALAAKSGSLFGRVRNEVGVITTADDDCYVFAVLTRLHRPFAGTAMVDAAMVHAVRLAIEELSSRDLRRE